MELEMASVQGQVYEGGGEATVSGFITIVVLLAGVIGGLIIVFITIFICKHCFLKKKNHNRLLRDESFDSVRASRILRRYETITSDAFSDHSSASMEYIPVCHRPHFYQGKDEVFTGLQEITQSNGSLDKVRERVTKYGLDSKIKQVVSNQIDTAALSANNVFLSKVDNTETIITLPNQRFSNEIENNAEEYPGREQRQKRSIFHPKESSTVLKIHEQNLRPTFCREHINYPSLHKYAASESLLFRHSSEKYPKLQQRDGKRSFLSHSYQNVHLLKEPIKVSSQDFAAIQTAGIATIKNKIRNSTPMLNTDNNSIIKSCPEHEALSKSPLTLSCIIESKAFFPSNSKSKLSLLHHHCHCMDASSLQVPENVANKKTSAAHGTSSLKKPNRQLVDVEVHHFVAHDLQMPLSNTCDLTLFENHPNADQLKSKLIKKLCQHCKPMTQTESNPNCALENDTYLKNMEHNKRVEPINYITIRNYNNGNKGNTVESGECVSNDELLPTHTKEHEKFSTSGKREECEKFIYYGENINLIKSYVVIRFIDNQKSTCSKHRKSIPDYDLHDSLEITEFSQSFCSDNIFDAIPISKTVRYNDTGSMEEIQVVNDCPEDAPCVLPSNTCLVSCDEDNSNIEHREIWRIRALLENEEDCSDTILIENTTSHDDSPAMELKPTTITLSTGSVCLQQHNVLCIGENRDEGENLFKISPKEVFDDIIDDTSESNSRTCHQSEAYRESSLRCQIHHQHRKNKQGHHSPKYLITERSSSTGQSEASNSSAVQKSAQNSFDSVETEADGSDNWRNEFISKSFDSNTDNTDSTTESQHCRLRQMKTDSGYKSLEMQQSGAKDNSDIIEIGDIMEECATERNERDTISSIGISETENAILPYSCCQCEQLINTEERRNSDVIRFERRTGHTASKKRREYRNERQNIHFSGSLQVNELYETHEDDFTGDNDQSIEIKRRGSHDDINRRNVSHQQRGHQLGPQVNFNKRSIFTRFFSQDNWRRKYAARNYCIDEKTNSIFNEFLRQDSPNIEQALLSERVKSRRVTIDYSGHDSVYSSKNGGSCPLKFRQFPISKHCYSNRPKSHSAGIYRFRQERQRTPANVGDSCTVSMLHMSPQDSIEEDGSGEEDELEEENMAKCKSEDLYLLSNQAPMKVSNLVLDQSKTDFAVNHLENPIATTHSLAEDVNTRFHDHNDQGTM